MNIFLIEFLNTYSFQSECPNYIFSKWFHFYTGYFEVTINFSIIRPIFIAFNLNDKKNTLQGRLKCVIHFSQGDLIPIITFFFKVVILRFAC